MRPFYPSVAQLFDTLLTVVLQNQCAISPTLQKPLTDELALLLLSRPVCCFGQAMVLEFCGVFWTILPGVEPCGFFATEDEALSQVQRLLPQVA